MHTCQYTTANYSYSHLSWYSISRGIYSGGVRRPASQSSNVRTSIPVSNTGHGKHPSKGGWIMNTVSHLRNCICFPQYISWNCPGSSFSLSILLMRSCLPSGILLFRIAALSESKYSSQFWCPFPLIFNPTLQSLVILRRLTVFYVWAVFRPTFIASYRVYPSHEG